MSDRVAAGAAGGPDGPWWGPDPGEESLDAIEAAVFGQTGQPRKSGAVLLLDR